MINRLADAIEPPHETKPIDQYQETRFDFGLVFTFDYNTNKVTAAAPWLNQAIACDTLEATQFLIDKYFIALVLR